VLGLATACWYGIALVLLSRARGKQLAWMPWLNTTIEASLGAIVVAVAVRLRGEAWTAGSALPLLWPLTLLLVSARLRPVLCLYATALALVEHALVHQLALGPALSHLPGAPFPTSVLFERSFWLLVGGVGAAALAAGLAAELSRQDAAARGRLALERELGRFVSTDVADAILRGEFAPGAAEKREVTVLFCDLRNFTGMCEREAPEAVVELLNEFYARAHAAVAAHGGTINKFLGDGFLALFNAPAEHPNHAYAAASVAHDLVDIAAALRARGGIFSSFDLGVGIDTGEVVVGAVGGPSRAEFTAIGAAVNRAARLQGLAGAGGHRVMLSAETAERLGPRANVVQVGSHQLKGFARPQPVYAFRYA
jgi:adenylate cyclase